MKVPFSDVNAQHEELKSQIDSAINKVIKRGDFILGEEVKLFEQEFSGFCETRFAVGVSSGTAALFLALASLDIKPGDEVIVPDFTYIATALAVSYTGAVPVFVDINEKTYNIDVSKIRQAITKKTKAILPVHLYGQPANMAEIMRIAKEYNLKVIEDAAQAHGARVSIGQNKWKPTGGLSDIGCFSFYPSKNLGALGDGGMVVTSDEKIYHKLLMLRDYGRVSKYEHSLIGYNSRLDTLQAAVLRVKLKYIDSWNQTRRKLANLYDCLFHDESQITTPYAQGTVQHVYHVYAIRALKRDLIHEELKKKGVTSIIHYPIPVHLQKAYANLKYKKGDFPVSERVAKEILSLPMSPHSRPSQIKYVVSSIKKIIGK